MSESSFPNSSGSEEEQPLFRYVKEPKNRFLALFPYRFSYIYAPHPAPGQRPDWKTETKHPLSDRLIQQGAMLYGVRFGQTTRYAMLDIDRGSAYHPSRDPFAIDRLLTALEPLGIVRHLKILSSSSGGLHIYLPLHKALKCSPLALAIQTLVERDGFKVEPGHLELFPDPKPYIPKGPPRNFAPHRLPLQHGSYMIDADGEPYDVTQDSFIKQWQDCATNNQVKESTIQQIFKVYRRRQYSISGNAAKFLNDLNTEIEEGWSSHGQTNWLLGRIAMREYIFGHFLYQSTPMRGLELVERIVKTATELPGYNDWCRHRHEISKRAGEWAEAVEASRYFHYGSKKRAASPSTEDDPPLSLEPTWNERQSQEARERIRRAIAHLLNTNTLPAKAGARFAKVTAMGISGATLYGNRDLWHPKCLDIEENTMDPMENKPVENEPVENVEAKSDNLKREEGIYEDSILKDASLLGGEGCNTAQGKGCSDQKNSPADSGCNYQAEDLAIFEVVQPVALKEAWQNQRRIRLERSQQLYIEKMQRWMDSGDPILMAEAWSWAQVNPGILKIDENLPKLKGSRFSKPPPRGFKPPNS
jgi:hypothetical protein